MVVVEVVVVVVLLLLPTLLLLPLLLLPVPVRSDGCRRTRRGRRRRAVRGPARRRLQAAWTGRPCG
jgi:hypothetical protein